MKTDREDVKTDSETESEEEGEKTINNQQQPLETPYVENVTEELGQVGIRYMLTKFESVIEYCTYCKVSICL